MTVQPAADTLVHVLLHHPVALEFDWSHLFGFGLAELATGRISVARAITLTAGVLAEPGSHTLAAVRAAAAEARKSTPAQLEAMRAREEAWARGDFDTNRKG